jgi:DNA-binding NarL/FixJ family response regulator
LIAWLQADSICGVFTLTQMSMAPVVPMVRQAETEGSPFDRRPVVVAVVDARAECRDGLTSRLAAEPGFRCLGTFRSMEWVASAPALRACDVVIVDPGPTNTAFAHIQTLTGRPLAPRVLVHTDRTDDESVDAAVAAGAAGYVVKGSEQRLLDAVRDVQAGGCPLSPQIARRVVVSLRRLQQLHEPPSPDMDEPLTPHETRVLKLLVDGHTYKTAGERLHVSVNTISFHMRRVYAKLDVHSKSEAVSKALRHRIVQ